MGGAVTEGAGGGGAEVVTLEPTQGWRQGREAAVTVQGKGTESEQPPCDGDTPGAAAAPGWPERAAGRGH